MAKSLAEAAANLSNLCFLLESDEPHEIDASLVAQFQDALSDVTKSVERRKAFYRELESKIEMAKAYRDDITKQLKRYELIKERLVAYTKALVEEHTDIPFKDAMGRALKVVPNPTPRLVIGDTFTTSDIDTITEYMVTPPQELDRNRVKADLLNGKEIPWAHLEYGTQLRGLK